MVVFQARSLLVPSSQAGAETQNTRPAPGVAGGRALTHFKKEKTMKVYWWQGGLHLQPENEKESEALGLLTDSLNLVNVDHGVPRGPDTHRGNEDSIVAMHELP
jgi:hypothetical protein